MERVSEREQAYRDGDHGVKYELPGEGVNRTNRISRMVTAETAFNRDARDMRDESC